MGKGLHVCKNDTVVVIAGNHKGKRGRVLSVDPKHGKVIVEGVNYVWKHVRPSQKSPRGGRIQIEAAIDVSNVMLVCGNKECAQYDQRVRTKKIIRQDGTKARGCVACGAEIARRLD